VRFFHFMLLFPLCLPWVQPPEAWAIGGDGVVADRFFSERKLLDAYSGFRHYSDSNSGGKTQERSRLFPKKFEIMARLVDTNRVSREMLYGIFRIGDDLARDIQRKVPDYLVEGICGREEFRSLHLDGTQEPLLREIVKAQLFLDDPEEIEKARKDFDVSIIKKQSEASGRKPPIPMEKLSVNGMPAGTCLASMPDGDCLVTLGEFNAYLPYADAQTGESVAEARERLLRAYVFRKLKSLEGRREINQAEKEKIIQQVKDAQEYRRVRASLMGLGLAVVDAASLSAAYQKHYRRYFAQRDSVLIQVMASTDSLLLDSLHDILEQGSAKPKPATHPMSVSDGDSALPWMTFSEADLPREIVAPTDTFKVGQFSKVFRTPAGYFMAKLSDIIRIPGTPPERAQAMCIYLATWDKYLGMDSILMAKSKKYYQDHSDAFMTPDTVAYDFWLAPRGKYRDIRMYIADTSRFKSMGKLDTDLPPAITKKIKTSAIPSSLKLHMVETKFGQMLVKIRSIKKGGRPIPFAKAKRGILEKITAIPSLPPAPSLAAAPADSAVSQEVLFTMGTENLVFSSIFDQSPSLSKSEIDAAIAAGHIQMNAKGEQPKDDKFYEDARQKMQFYNIEKKHEAIQDELSKVVFNTGFYSAN
jgi:hypothetical protein